MLRPAGRPAHRRQVATVISASAAAVAAKAQRSTVFGGVVKTRTEADNHAASGRASCRCRMTALGFLSVRSQMFFKQCWNYVDSHFALLHAKFHPHRCNDKGVGPPKLKFLLRFDRNLEYKRPAGAYLLRDFHKICRVCTSFQDALGVKIWLDLLKGLWSYGGFKLRGSSFPQIFSAP